jgi:hypothetical protein
VDSVRAGCGFVTLSGIPDDIDTGMPKVGTTSHL